MSMNELSAEYTKAVDLDRRIKVSIQLAQQNLYDMCMGFKEMRDSGLYKELGYSEFDDYCKKEVEFSDRQVYKYISIVENLPQDLVKSTSLIGTEKLYFLSRLDEPQREEIQQNTDLESVSVRELKAKIDDLKKANDRLMQKNSDAEENARKSQEKESEAWGKVSILRTDTEMQKQKISQLESEIKVKNDSIAALEEQIEELENRPIEVAVEDNKDDIRKLNDKHNAELEKIKTEYEQKLSEAEKNISGESVTDTKAIFKAYLSNAVDSVYRLLSFLASNPDEEFFTNKTIEFFNRALDGVGNIKK